MKSTNNNMLNTQHSNRIVVVSTAVFLLTISYCFASERTRIFQKDAKEPDSQLFLLFIGVCVLLTLPSWTNISTSAQVEPIHKPVRTSLLPREQTEEWKGWMQMVILVYHYFGLSKNLPIYQFIRVLVSSYIFLTGYNHATYFLKTNDFSLERTTKNLLRLNFLSCILSFVCEKRWEFYYFPVLTSFWYLVVFATMYHGRTPSGRICLSRVCVVLAISFTMVQASLFTSSGHNVWRNILRLIGAIGGPAIQAQELLFRLKLDSMVPFWGVLLAVTAAKFGNRPADWIENYPRQLARAQAIIAHLPWISFGMLVSYFLAIQHFEDKSRSNKWHPFISIVPVTAMLMLRNGSYHQRQGFNRIFRWLGTISLELYLLQSHLWLASNNKELLHVQMLGQVVTNTTGVLSTWTYCFDKLIMTTVFLLLSHFVANFTKHVIDWLTAGRRTKLIAALLICWMLNVHWTLLLHKLWPMVDTRE